MLFVLVDELDIIEASRTESSSILNTSSWSRQQLINRSLSLIPVVRVVLGNSSAAAAQAVLLISAVLGNRSSSCASCLTDFYCTGQLEQQERQQLRQLFPRPNTIPFEAASGHALVD